MLERIVMGTANWAKEYNGHKVSEKEQQLIMEYMKEIGIEWLDVATAYGTEDIGKDDFRRIIKTDSRKEHWQVSDDIHLGHHCWQESGISIDSVAEISLADGLPMWIEFPYSIVNRNKAIMMLSGLRGFIARSIFCKGKALKYFSPQACIDFVLMNPRIDKVIIGVDSADQLRQNVAHLVKMEKFTHNEEVDTRKFERKDL